MEINSNKLTLRLLWKVYITMIHTWSLTLFHRTYTCTQTKPLTVCFILKNQEERQGEGFNTRKDYM